MISREILHLLEAGSDIRKVWEAGFRLKKLHGAENVADLTLGNPLLSPPPELLLALEDVVAKPPPGLHRYTPNAGDPEVRERIAEHLNRREILPDARGEHVVVTAGACAATNVALRAVLDPGDEVILLVPYFPDYPAHVLNHRGSVVTVPCDGDFLPDLAAIEAALGPRTRVVIVNHPNNPSGRQYSGESLEQLAELLRAHTRLTGRAVYLISDEPYREIRFTAEPFISPARLYEYGLIAYSFSKSHAIPGERIGYLAVNPQCPAMPSLVPALALSNRILGFPNAPSLWQQVIVRCLDAVVDLEQLRRFRDALCAALQDKGYEVAVPEGAFYLFPRTPGGDDERFVERMLERLVLVVPGRTFGLPGQFRMAFCVDDRTVELALEKLPAADSWFT